MVPMKNLTVPQILFFAYAALLLICLLPLSNSLYSVIDILVALAGGYMVFIAIRVKKFVWVVPGLAGFILYLPIVDHHKSTWIILDVVFIAVFVVAGFLFGAKKPES